VAGAAGRQALTQDHLRCRRLRREAASVRCSCACWSTGLAASYAGQGRDGRLRVRRLKRSLSQQPSGISPALEEWLDTASDADQALYDELGVRFAGETRKQILFELRRVQLDAPDGLLVEIAQVISARPRFDLDADGNGTMTTSDGETHKVHGFHVKGRTSFSPRAD
jgi:hypothetical protein